MSYQLNLTKGLLGSLQQSFPHKPDMPEALVQIVARVLETYVAEEQPTDDETQKLIYYAEELCIVIEQSRLQFEGRPGEYHNWKMEIMLALTEHARYFGQFYQDISHLRTDFFCANAWIIATVVDLAVNHVSGERDVEEFMFEEIEHKIRLGENILSEIYVAVKASG